MTNKKIVITSLIIGVGVILFIAGLYGIYNYPDRSIGVMILIIVFITGLSSVIADWCGLSE